MAREARQLQQRGRRERQCTVSCVFFFFWGCERWSLQKPFWLLGGGTCDGTISSGLHVASRLPHRAACYLKTTRRSIGNAA